MLRAAVEAEAHLDQPRFEAFDHQPSMLIASASAWADYARQLGAAADACALADPLLPPSRVLETLEGVSLPQSSTARMAAGALPIGPLTPTTAAATGRLGVAQGSRVQSARNLPARHGAAASPQAVTGCLVGAPELTVADIQGRVQGRYPEAAGLPHRPELDRLLEESGAPLAWDATAADGRGAFRLVTLGRAQTAGTTTQFSRHATLLTAHASGDNDVVQAAAVEDRLVRGLQQGGMLVLTVHPRIARHAEAELLHRFGTPGVSPAPLQRVNFDALLLTALRDQAKTAGRRLERRA